MKAEKFLNAIGGIDEKYLDIEIPKKIKHHRLRGGLAAIAAAALLITVPLPAMTAFGSDGAYNILYNISPKIAQDFKPVQKSCIDDGIEMTVVSAKCEGSRAEIYLTMRDLTGECRYGDWDLFDSERLNVWKDMIGNCRFADYDEETKTAQFVVMLETMDGSPMPKKKVTFSVSELLLGKKKTEGTIDVDMSAVPYEPEAVHRDDIDGGSFYYGEPDYDSFRFLVADDEPVCRPADNAAIDAIGYVDGALHILTRYEDSFHTDSHGFIRLVDSDKNDVVDESEYKMYTYWYDPAHTDMCYEYIIPVEYEKLRDCTLYGEFSTALGYRKGNWQVTFPLE